MEKKEEEKEAAPISIEEERLGSDSMSKDIKVDRFDISYPGRTLFKDANLLLAHGRKYGLVAPNGVGKSTLLDYIAHVRSEIGSGIWPSQRRNEFIAIPKHFDILYVEQEVIGDTTSAIDSVIAADTERTRLLEEEKRLLNDEDDDGNNGDRLALVHGRLETIEAYSAEARASAILTGSEMREFYL